MAEDDQPVTRREFREVTEQLQSSINDSREEAGRRFDKIEGRFDKIEGRVGQVEGRLDRVETRLDQIERTQDKILDTLQRIEAMLKQLQDIPARVTRLEQKVFGR